LEELTDHVELALEVPMIAHRLAPANEDLGDVGLDRERAGADEVVVGGDLAPSEQVLAFLVDDGVQEGADPVPLLGISRQEHDPAAVLAGRWQADTQSRALAPQELVGHLEEDAGAVTGVRLAPARAPVQQVDEDLERLAHDRVRAAPLDVHDEADAAGVVLAARVVQAL